jgi:hypothetical protein
MSPAAPPAPLENERPARDPQVLEQIYSVPLERPVGRELFTVMASLLAHVLHVNELNQPGSPHE